MLHECSLLLDKYGTAYGLITYTITYSVLHECSLLLDKYGTTYGLITYTNTYSVLHECSLLLDKYGTAYGAGGQSQMYVYHHEEDESTYRLVDTSRPQRPIHHKPRGRLMQVHVRLLAIHVHL